MRYDGHGVVAVELGLVVSEGADTVRSALLWAEACSQVGQHPDTASVCTVHGLGAGWSRRQLFRLRNAWIRCTAAVAA